LKIGNSLCATIPCLLVQVHKKFAPRHALTQIPLFVSQPAVFALFTFLLRFLMLPVVGAKRVGQSGGILGLKANFLSTARTRHQVFNHPPNKNYAQERAVLK
jgi:hypothetical protein